MPRLIPLIIDIIGLATLLAAVKRIGRFELATERLPFTVRLALAQLLALGDFALDTTVDLFRKRNLFFRPIQPSKRRPGSRTLSNASNTVKTTLTTVIDVVDSGTSDDGSMGSTSSEVQLVQDAPVAVRAQEWGYYNGYGNVGAWVIPGYQPTPIDGQAVPPPTFIANRDHCGVQQQQQQQHQQSWNGYFDAHQQQQHLQQQYQQQQPQQQHAQPQIQDYKPRNKSKRSPSAGPLSSDTRRLPALPTRSSSPQPQHDSLLYSR